MTEAYLLLGSNLGDRRQCLAEAIHSIDSDEVKVTAQSSIYETESWGFDGPSFYNQAVKVETALSPHELLAHCLGIEKEMGRTRTDSPGYESRSIDIDILIYGDLELADDTLTIPHPELPNRRFALIPLNELLRSRSIDSMIETCEDPIIPKQVMHA